MLPRLFGALLLLPFLVAEPANACSCGPWPPPADAFEMASGVFAGAPVAITPVDAETVRVEFAVSRVWKGEIAPTLYVLTAADDAMCGYPFEVGVDYLVYANGEPYWTTYCDRTNLLADAGEDLEWLGEGVVPVASEPEAPGTSAALSPTFPNPFRTATHVDVTLDRPGCADLRVYDLQGRLVRDLPRAACSAGHQQVRIDLVGSPPGAYVVELRTATEVLRRRMTLVR